MRTALRLAPAARPAGLPQRADGGGRARLADGGSSRSTRRRRSQRPRAAPAPAPAGLFKHAGPLVAPGGNGAARYALLAYEAFDAERALQLAEYVDRFWREPGNDG
jgi:hypothetical protein